MSSYERVNEPTPAGGDYSEINYLNDDNDVVDSSEAKKCVIRECKADGTHYGALEIRREESSRRSVIWTWFITSTRPRNQPRELSMT